MVVTAAAGISPCSQERLLQSLRVCNSHFEHVFCAEKADRFAFESLILGSKLECKMAFDKISKIVKPSTTMA